MWISKGVGEKIEPKTLVVFETVGGDKYIFNTDIISSINILAEHFNKNGKNNDKMTTQIVDETIKLNNLKDLVENYYYNNGIKQYGKTLSKLCKESLNKLNTLEFSEEDTFDYSKELAIIEGKTGFQHPGLKYIAIEEAKNNKIKNDGILIEHLSDKNILKSGFSKFMSFKKANELSSSIINTKLSVITPIKETKEPINVIKQLIDNVYSADNNIKESVNECFKAIALYPNVLSNNKTKFVNTLKKYLI